MEYFISNGGTLGPAKAANAGGVAKFSLEMAQNSMRYNSTRAEEVDAKLKKTNYEKTFTIIQKLRLKNTVLI